MPLGSFQGDIQDFVGFGKGWKYLSDNSTLKRIENIMKGIKDSVSEL